MKQRLFVIIFTCAMMLFVAVNTMAGNDFQSNLDEAESEVNKKEEQLQEIQDLLSQLNNSRDDLDVYLDNLAVSYEALSNYITGLQEEITIKQGEIESINVELDKAQTEKTEQYESMKKRIQYMYENGQSEMFLALFSDMSISEILNKLEYNAKLLEYDRAKLDEYEELLTYIAAVKIELEKDLDDLGKLVAEQEQKQKDMGQMMADAASNISDKEAEIDAAEARAIALAEEIQAGKDTIEQLKAEESRRIEESIRASKEQASREQAGIYEEATTAGYYPATDEEVMMMAAILYCEARGESYQGILAVGSVVMNRVADPRFPNTIEGVIMSPYQFSPVASGLYAIALAKGANETCIKAAKEVLYDGVRIGPWLYFRTVNNIIQGTVIGNHVFY